VGAPDRRIAVANTVTERTRTRSRTVAPLAFKIHFGDRIPEADTHPNHPQPRV
jgi:hypothetical protein